LRGENHNPYSQLHSRYNPQAEAERYIDSLKLKESIECFILIEPGIGYLIPALQNKFNNSKIIVLHIENNLQKEEYNDPLIISPAGMPLKGAVHFGTESTNVKKFLENEVQPLDIDRIRIIEWRPSLNHYKDVYISLLTQVVEFLKQMDAEKRTTDAFGKRWFKNFFKNLGKTGKTLLYKQTELPVIVIGSGPSLEEVLPIIKKIQNNHLIIAASSSITALQVNGITADIIITTDGGNWAMYHSVKHYRQQPDTTLAVNLCAALPSQTENIPFLIINDGSFWQSIILHELDIPSVIIPQKGTVTATAVELAMLLSSGCIYLAGMDFSNSDIRTHVRPYAFDNIFFGSANRFNPVYTTYFTRSALLHEGGSMNIYASWFKDQITRWPQRIFSLTSHKIFNNKTPDDNKNKKNLKEIFKTEKAKEDPAGFCKKGMEALFASMNNPVYSEKIKEELIPLLLPDKTTYQKSKILKHELEAAIKRELKTLI